MEKTVGAFEIRQVFFDQMRAVSEHANLTEGEADELVAEAIPAVRATPTA